MTWENAQNSVAVGQHTAIPRTDADLQHKNFIQAMANTAGFHFPTIEQGGNSLYPSLAQRATSAEVLRILISIGPTETMHFQSCNPASGSETPALYVRGGAGRYLGSTPQPRLLD